MKLGFLKKVYGILTTQLLLTVFVSAVFMLAEPIKLYVQQSPGLLMLSYVLSLVSLAGVMVQRKEHPSNMYWLAFFVGRFKRKQNRTPRWRIGSADNHTVPRLSVRPTWSARSRRSMT